MALIAAHLNAGRSGGDSVAIGIYSPSSPTSLGPTPFPPFSPSLISLMVSVDVKHHVYLLTYLLKRVTVQVHGRVVTVVGMNVNVSSVKRVTVQVPG